MEKSSNVTDPKFRKNPKAVKFGFFFNHFTHTGTEISKLRGAACVTFIAIR